MPRRCCRSRSRSRIWAWIVTSSAVVGSSAISSEGSQDKAIAIITRWRMPPDSWCGKSSNHCAGDGMRTSSSTSIARARAASLDKSECAWIASTIWRPMRCTGFSEVIGSWRTIAMRPPRSNRRSLAGKPSTSRPSKTSRSALTRPGGEGTRPISDSEVTLLPQPDSPTRPTERARPTEKLMPSTALNSPRSVSNQVRRFCTSSSGGAAAAAAPAGTCGLIARRPVPCRRCTGTACAPARP